MIRILIPSMGTSAFFKDSFFPKPLYEISGKTILEMVVEDYNELPDKQFIFVFSKEDCQQFHLDLSAKVLCPESQVIQLSHQTAGALCTCLMAIDSIQNDEPLIISNGDQVIDVNYQTVVESFVEKNADAGIITFPNIHPRCSYAKKQGDQVVEVAEKRPISRDALTGFFYFRKGRDFVEAAKQALIKQTHLNGKYYLSSAINELILMGKQVAYYDISKEQYSSFYSPVKIDEYAEKLKAKRGDN
ncbi:MAG: glycosyltransferase family 2 protein [Clostridiales bacterium]|nr:glycosyltransferase family 2 protein [Clostridia bacterium]MCR4882660.1 glycosyltransferase family 2 protein [Clostridiales bacterium]